MKTLSKGFTLIELMIVVAIIAIIAAIAMPAYSDYVTRAKRTDAKNALLMIQLAEEKWRANNSDYGTIAEIYPNGTHPSDWPTLKYVSPDKHYNLNIVVVSGVPGVSPSIYTVTATTSATSNDSVKTTQIDPLCLNFVYAVSGAVESVTGTANATPDTCWKR